MRTRTHSQAPPEALSWDIERQMRLADKSRRRMIVAGSAAAAVTAAIVVGAAVLFTSSSTPAPQAPKRIDRVAAPSAEATDTADQSELATRQPPATSTEPSSDPAATEKPTADRAPKPVPVPKKEPAAPAVQRASIAIGEAGYNPTVVTLNAGTPIELTVGKGEGCAAGFLITQLGVSADNSNGPAKVSLPALQPGTYRFTCGMEMVEGRLVIQ